VDFSAGGFGPQYGNYWGGVVDITQRDARMDRWGGRAEVNMLLSEGLVEGPITSNSSLAVAGRRSYLELFSGVFAGSSLTVIPSFGDYQVKYSYDYSKQTHWDFQAFGSDDRLGLTIAPDSNLAKQDPAYAGVFEFHNGYDSQGVNFRRVADDQNTLFATAYHTNFFFDTHLGRDLHLDINFEDFGGRLEWRHDSNDQNLMVGMEYDHTITGNNSYFVDIPGEGTKSFDLTTAQKISANENYPADNIGVYGDEKFKWLDKKLELSLGLRGDYLAYNTHFTWGPRISAAYLLSDDTTLKGSYGYYYQLPWQGPYLDPSFGNPKLFSEKGISAILGVEQKLGDGFYARVEGYNKDLTDVVVSDSILHYSNDGTGYSRGVEFFLRRAPTERFFGWISYAFSDSVRHNAPGDTHVYDYDQPNIATIVASYKINPGWDVGIKWRYSSGLPQTPITGSTYEPIYSRYTANYGPVNSSRVPDYHRLDFSTSLSTVYDTWQWRFYLEILNVYNHANVFGYDYNYNYDPSKTKEIDQLPFLPYIGFEVKY
jgi:outer membrane cobalamin receptor